MLLRLLWRTWFFPLCMLAACDGGCEDDSTTPVTAAGDPETGTPPSAVGVLDLTFDGDGTASFPGGAAALAIQPDGKIVVTGSSSPPGTVVVARYESNGSLDSSFGVAGIATGSLGAGTTSGGVALALRADGKILVAALVTLSSSSDFGVIQFTSSGFVDSEFGIGGSATTSIGTLDVPRGIALQPDGMIVVAGESGTTDWDFSLVRCDEAGTLDPNFGNGGRVLTDLGGSETASAVGLQTDGRIVMAGYSSSGTNPNMITRVALTRYLTNGDLDPDFGNGGKVLTSIHGDDYSMDLALQNDGKIVVVGFTFEASVGEFLLLRYGSEGALDPSFGSDGVATALGGTGSEAYAVALQADGRILAAGGGLNGAPLLRFEPNGAADPTFGENGLVVQDLGMASFRGMAIQTDGKIVAVSGSYVIRYR